jgi:hypothetical protein
MKVQLTTYYADGSSGITEIEKPAGAHPDSISVLAEGLLVAEKNWQKSFENWEVKSKAFFQSEDRPGH